MTERKARPFPLPLSLVVGGASRKSARTVVGAARFSSPQTAAQNAAHNAAKKTLPMSSQLLRKPLAEALERTASQGGNVGLAQPGSGMLVSHAVRRAMAERLARQGIKDAKVLQVMEAAPRHLFLDPALASQAYIDASLPIGYQQTISQPYIVARMIEILRENRKGGVLDRVLEIGTGCGYQALVLSMVAKDVYSIERIKALHELAKNRLRPLRVPNIRLHFGDGMLGLPQAAPFDGIILAAAGLDVPKSLLEQLAIGGRLIAPVGGSQQSLQLIERTSASKWDVTMLEKCHFVPLLAGTV